MNIQILAIFIAGVGCLSGCVTNEVSDAQSGGAAGPGAANLSVPTASTPNSPQPVKQMSIPDSQFSANQPVLTTGVSNSPQPTGQASTLDSQIKSSPQPVQTVQTVTVVHTQRRIRNTPEGQQDYTFDRQTADQICMNKAQDARQDSFRKGEVVGATFEKAGTMSTNNQNIMGLGGILGNIINTQTAHPEFDYNACIEAFMKSRGW